MTDGAAETRATEPGAPTRALRVLGRAPRTKWEALEAQQKQILEFLNDLARQNIEARNAIQTEATMTALMHEACAAELVEQRKLVNDTLRLLGLFVAKGVVTQDEINAAVNG